MNLIFKGLSLLNDNIIHEFHTLIDQESDTNDKLRRKAKFNWFQNYLYFLKQKSKFDAFFKDEKVFKNNLT